PPGAPGAPAAGGGRGPGPAARGLLWPASARQRGGGGLVLLVGFSAGMAVVLTGIGLGVVYGKGRWGESGLGGSVWGRRLPVVAAGVIVLVGVWMTGMALRG
ncbi:MAG: hypothetical protein ACK55F_16135, partial [Acidobacteriota bacterium]